MHGMELVGVDLDASPGQFTLDRHRLEAALGKLRLQRLLVNARHGPGVSAANFQGASYRRCALALNSTHVRSRCARGATPSALLRGVIRGCAFRGSRPRKSA